MARKGENIYKRKDGRYEGRYIISYDENGKAKYKHSSTQITMEYLQFAIFPKLA